MSYRVRFTTHTGATGYWDGTFATHTGASMSAQTRADVTGYTYTVEEVPDAPEPKPEPTSTTERLVGLIRDRHAKGLAKYGTTLDRADLSPENWAQHAIEEALDLAGYLMRVKDGFATQPGSMAARHVEILREHVKDLMASQETMRRNLHLALSRGNALRDAMRTGEWHDRHDRNAANSARTSWDSFKARLAKAPGVPEAPREGGDSDRRRLEVLNDWIRGGHRAFGCQNGIVVALDGLCLRPVVEAPTLPALADKLAAKEDKP